MKLWIEQVAREKSIFTLVIAVELLQTNGILDAIFVVFQPFASLKTIGQMLRDRIKHKCNDLEYLPNDFTFVEFGLFQWNGAEIRAICWSQIQLLEIEMSSTRKLSFRFLFVWSLNSLAFIGIKLGAILVPWNDKNNV